MRGGIKRMQINKTCINNIYDIRVKEDFIFKENNKIPFINIKSEYDYKIYEIESEIESGIESKGYESESEIESISKGYESKGYESKRYESISKGYDSKGYESKGYESKGYESKGYESKGYESKGYDSISKGINRYESKGYDSISKGCYLCGREYIVSKCIEGICYDPIAEYDSMDSVLDSSRGLGIVIDMITLTLIKLVIPLTLIKEVIPITTTYTHPHPPTPITPPLIPHPHPLNTLDSFILKTLL
ncbi:hypothetical protein LUQ84_003115 [Hamiltosporidium tvaerminnensis]|nr:hypothetical protein LUQ84_003115 [Hamiltosporidium tvaerminnensis]